MIGKYDDDKKLSGAMQPEGVGHTQTFLQPSLGAGTMHNLPSCQLGEDSLPNMVIYPQGHAGRLVYIECMEPSLCKALKNPGGVSGKYLYKCATFKTCITEVIFLIAISSIHDRIAGPH